MKQLVNPVLIIAVATILRLLPHAPNVAPITAMALFGGTYLNKKYALAAPLAAMLISDLFLGFHDTLPFVYISFILSGLIGLYLKNRKSLLNVATASILSSAAFFLITNFGVWIVGDLYPRTPEGLLNCFILAIPFFRNTLLGDLFYVIVLFGSYEVAKSLVQKPNIHKLKY